MVSTVVTPSPLSSSSRSQRVAPGLRVHPRGRLVDEQQLGPPHERHGQGQPLLLATRQPPVRRTPARLRARAAPPASGRGAGWACRAAMWRSISSARTPVQAPPDCSITPMRGSRARRSATGSSPSTRTVPPCGLAEALAGLERGRLAGAVGPEDGGDAAALDGQAEAVDGGLVAVPHDESVDLDRRRGGRGQGHARQSRDADRPGPTPQRVECLTRRVRRPARSAGSRRAGRCGPPTARPGWTGPARRRG